jgi:hypothetical protein
MQWHGPTHFLSDFPATAAPGLLPPNLALLAGVRDAQAYNPLLLRRAVDYYARLNHGRTDDHWLLVDDFRSPLVDALAVRRVLTGPGTPPGGATDTGGERWRLASPLLEGASVTLPGGAAPAVLWRPDPGDGRPPPQRLYVVSYLGEATAVPQDAPAIEVQVDGTGPAGEAVGRTATLRAGVETAEWAYGRPDVRAAVRHRQAPVALQTRLTGAVGGTYPVYEYLAAVDLTGLRAVREVRARGLVPGVTAYVAGLYLEPGADGRFRPAPGGVENTGALPRARLAGPSGPSGAGSSPEGEVTWLGDLPERVDLRVVSPDAGRLILADAFYPGWTATVDGTPAAVDPEEGLFRSVPVGPGAHDVSFVYRPATLRLGGALSLTGVLVVALALCLPRFSRRGRPGRVPVRPGG